MFLNCYSPQLIMRIIFTAYAIAAALLCFLLTFCLAFLPENMVEYCAVRLFTVTYILFGPLLLIFGLYGLFYFKSILHECSPNGVT
mmetsp:Transcript_44608/g.43252  ORF Transcript_44608/g.43252 Transcript_44608/m.43252 type:complete len:86 (-) Transcript_44608:449-706(-)